MSNSSGTTTFNVKMNIRDALSKINSLGSSFKQAGTKLAPVAGAIKDNVDKTVQGWVSGTQKMANAIGTLKTGMTNLIDGTRQVTQGFLSMGRALTFFISLPLTAFLKEAIQSSIEYEKALFRVAKVASFKSGENDIVQAGQDYQALDKYIREITSVAGSSHEQFLSWAESLGSFGVDSVEGMKQILPIIEMFVQGTDVAAESAVQDLGKIANQFGYAMSSSGEDLQRTIDFMWKFANTVNTMENITGATASNIIAAVADAGPTLTKLGVTPDIITSWAALGVQAGLTEGEVGTGLRNIGIMIAKSYEDIEKYPKLMEAVGVTSANAFKDILNIDPAGAIDKMLRYANTNKDVVQSITEMYDFLGMRGDKLFLALESQLDGAAKNAKEFASVYDEVMATASEQWTKPTSLMQEYEMMTQSTAFASQQLRNNIKNLGLTIGDALLPALNDAVKALSPLAQALSNVFKSLSGKTKNTIFLVVGLSAVIGPVVFFLSQMAFGLSLVASGLMKLGIVVGSAIKFFGVLGFQMLKLNPIAWGVAAGITGAFSLMKTGIGGVVSFIFDALGSLAKAMSSWGGGMFKALADGISGSQSVIVQAVTNIAEVISSFFRAFSPPKEGPLQHIDKWGANLFDTYLKGFLAADFGILKDVASIVQHVFSSWVDIGKIKDDGTMHQMVMQFRQDFALLLKTFNETGVIDITAINRLTAVLGEQSDEVAKLIELNLKLKKAELELKKIDENRLEVNKKFRNSLGKAITSDMSLEDKVAIMRQAQKERDREMVALDSEEQKLTKVRDSIKEQLDYHKEMLSAMQDQDDIYSKMLDAIEKFNKALEGVGGGIENIMSDLEGAGGGIEPIDLSGVGDATNYFSLKIAEMKLKAYELETVIRGVFKTIVSIFKGEGIPSFDELFNFKTDIEVKDLVGQFTSVIKGIKDVSTESETFDQAVSGIAKAFRKADLDRAFKLLANPQTTETLGEESAQVRGLYVAFKDLGADTDAVVTLEDLQDALDAKKPEDFAIAFKTVGDIGESVNDIYKTLKPTIEAFIKQGSRLKSILTNSFLAGNKGDRSYFATMANEIKVKGLGEADLSPLEKALSSMAEIGGVLIEHLPTIIISLSELATAVFNSFGRMNDGTKDAPSIAERIDKLLTSIEGIINWFAKNPKVFKNLVITLAIGKFILLPIASALFNTFGKQILIGLGSKVIEPAIKVSAKFVWGTLSKVVTSILKPLLSFLVTNPLVLTLAALVTLAVILDKAALKAQEHYFMSQGAENYDKLKKAYQDGIAQAAQGQARAMGGSWGFTQVGNMFMAPNPYAYNAGVRDGQNYNQGVKDGQQNPPPPPPAFTSADIIKTWSDRLNGQAKEYLGEAGYNAAIAFTGGFTGEIPRTVPKVEESLQNLFTVDPTTIQEWAKLLNVDVSTILSGEGIPKNVEFETPTLTFLNLTTKVTELVKSLMNEIVAQLSSTDFKIDDSLVATAVFSAIASGVEKATEVGSLFTGVAVKMSEAIMTNTAESTTAYENMKKVGQAFAGAIAEGIDDFFGSKSNASSFITVVDDTILGLTELGTNLSAAFTEASNGMLALNTMVTNGWWATFKSDVKLLASTSQVGGLAYVFEKAKTSIEGTLTAINNLITLISGTGTKQLMGSLGLVVTKISGDGANNIKGAFQTVINSISGDNGFIAVLNGAKGVAQEIKTIITDIYNTLSGLAVKTWIINVILNATSTAGGMQTGGSTYKSNTHIVGETGIELFTAPINGHITSHSLLSNMLSQAGNSTTSGNTYNVTVQGSPVMMNENDLIRMMDKMRFLYE